jgi:hypothetical protein
MGKMVSFGPLDPHRAERQGTVDVKSLGHPCYNTQPISEGNPESTRLFNEHLARSKNRTENGLAWPSIHRVNREVLVMSNPAPTSPSLHPTRRQLDELDALVDRMLELPVKPGEEEAKNSVNEDAILPDPAGAAVFAEFSPHGMASYHTHETEPSTVDSPGAFQFTSSDSAKRTSGSSALVRNGQSSFKVAHPTSSGTDDSPPVSIWLWPVVGINQTFDFLMGGLGNPGRIVRGTGRIWLGWVGLLMLAAALAWGVLDWLQWAG